jgi:molybdate transport system substrate-binding protein
MKPVKGLDVVGPLPAELQLVTRLSAALGAGATAPEAAKALIGFFASPEAAAVMRAKGLGPAGG